MSRKSNYDKYPTIDITSAQGECVAGWEFVMQKLDHVVAGRRPRVIVIETYPGTLDDEILPKLQTCIKGFSWILSRDAMKDEPSVRAMVQPDVTDDAVFGYMTRLSMTDYIDPEKRDRLSKKAKEAGPVVIYGVGASLIHRGDLTIYLDLARWEIQRRQRARLISNLGVNNTTDTTWRKYKWAYFVDWRVADTHKREMWESIDYFLDTNQPDQPRMVDAGSVRRGLAQCVKRPFRVVPFFDPGVWGGQWMRDVCDLPQEAINYAWCFDCVPEENSLLMRFGDHRIELPSINLVHQHPRELLGDAVYGRFGAEFPIRFDFLDTFEGGNLSLQVHPLTEYIQKHFGMNYTQDESYYILDAKDDACVYLGFKDNINPKELATALREAQKHADRPFDADRFVNRISARKHDHFLIPAGTIHCSGRQTMVLEISATPYIFTFKLWDWGRLDLDGKPRPINIDHGVKNLRYERNTQWTQANLVNRFKTIAHSDGIHEQHTGLHASEFIETRRHWFNRAVEHDTCDTVNVLNLVEGDVATVESPDHAFDPFEVHYAETFIVPAAVGKYIIRPGPVGKPSDTSPCATMKAYVRSNP